MVGVLYGLRSVLDLANARWERIMADETDWIDLSEAIEALRSALVSAWWDAQGRQVRFKLEPVELTVQVGVTRTGTGSAGVRWHVLSLGGQRTREAQTVQILKLRLLPVLLDEDGAELADSDQLIADRDD